MLNIRNIGNISNDGNGIILFMACVVLFAPNYSDLFNYSNISEEKK